MSERERFFRAGKYLMQLHPKLYRMRYRANVAAPPTIILQEFQDIGGHWSYWRVVGECP